MADNVPITAGSGTDVATDDIGSVHYQIVKIGVGAANAVDGHLDFGQGAMAASLPVVLASDQTAIPVTDNAGSITVDNAALAVTGGGVEASALRVTIASDSTGVVSIDDGGGSITVDGSLSFTPSTVSALHAVAAASDNAASVKASAGTLYGISFYNNAAYPIYVKFHNTAGTPTAGTGVVRTFAIQAGTQRDVVIPQGGVAFATGIGLTIVKDLADNGTTATAANDAVGEIWYA